MEIDAFKIFEEDLKHDDVSLSLISRSQ